MRKVFNASIVATLAAALIGIPSAAQAATASDTTLLQGQVVVVSGAGCTGNTPATYKVNSTTVATSTSGGGGSFKASVRVPPGTAVGTNRIDVFCGSAYPPGSQQVFHILIQVFDVVTVTDETPAPGQFVRMGGRGCAPNAAVTYQFDSASFGTSKASSTGVFARSMQVPRGAARGKHKFIAKCSEANLRTTNLWSVQVVTVS